MLDLSFPAKFGKKSPSRKKTYSDKMLNLFNEMLRAEELTEFSFKGKNVPRVNTFGIDREKSGHRDDHASISPRWNFLSTNSIKEACFDDEESVSESLESVFESQNNDLDCI